VEHTQELNQKTIGEQRKMIKGSQGKIRRKTTEVNWSKKKEKKIRRTRGTEDADELVVG
jgi:hypothetical protein